MTPRRRQGAEGRARIYAEHTTRNPREARVELAVEDSSDKDADHMTTPNRARILATIEKCDDPGALRRIMKNAKKRGGDEIYDAAFQRLITIQPSAQVGTIAHDIWRTIYAFEELLKEERGKTVRLTRTRQKIQKDGEIKTAMDLTLKTTPSDGFRMLKDRGMLELSFEALVVARAEHFPGNVVDAARSRLEAEGMDIQLAYAYWSKAG